MRPLCMTRRHWLASAGVAASTIQLACDTKHTSKAPAHSKLSMPGPFRGRVVAVEHPSAIIENVYQRDAISSMMKRGMTALGDAGGHLDTWPLLFQPGDVVGIKLNPVGRPHVISSPEVLHHIIAALKDCGVKAQDIVCYDRYKVEFLEAGFDKWLPDGVRWMHAAEKYENVQKNILGYDRDHFFELPLTLPGEDADDSENRRSYAAEFITKHVDKMINLCVLKDHQSAGITMALKNMSHGLVNNVNRSHATSTLNACGAFIPASVSLPVIRNKAVLHILDGVKGLYHGGPGAKPQFVWDHNTIYFATDPVALDHVGWRALDAKREQMGMKSVATDLPDKFSTFLRRQPEHVEIAGALGLGEWRWEKIDVRRVVG